LQKIPLGVVICPRRGRMEHGSYGQAAEKLDYLKGDKDYLGYLMSPDYIMQGPNLRRAIR